MEQLQNLFSEIKISLIQGSAETSRHFTEQYFFCQTFVAQTN